MAETYDVTAQRQTTTLTPAGRFEEVIEITFVTKPSGIALQESIPLRAYNDVEAVRETLAARAAQAESVHEL